MRWHILLAGLVLICQMGYAAGPLPMLDCRSFDSTKIRLISFDVFGALMLSAASIQSHVAQLVPSLATDPSRLERFVDLWFDAYAKAFGQKFTDPPSTRTPFIWVISEGLDSIIQELQIPGISRGDPVYLQLLATWGELTPRPGVINTLEYLHNELSLQLALLSNGDTDTLTRAATALAPSVKMDHIFGSDWPVMAFKPHPDVYTQVFSAEVGSGRPLQPQEFIHIAGSPFDAHGARAAGLFSGFSSNGEADDEPDHSTVPCFILDDITQLRQYFPKPSPLKPHAASASASASSSLSPTRDTNSAQVALFALVGVLAVLVVVGIAVVSRVVTRPAQSTEDGETRDTGSKLGKRVSWADLPSGGGSYSPPSSELLAHPSSASRGSGSTSERALYYDVCETF